MQNSQLQIDSEAVKIALGDWQLQTIMLQQYIKTLEDKIKQLNLELEIVNDTQKS